MAALAVHANGLVKCYGVLRAVDGLIQRVPEGVVYGFLGRNGAGKTTTMKMLLGLTRPDAGQAEVLGLDVKHNRLAILKRVAFVSEGKELYRSMTAAQQVRFNRPFYPSWSDHAAETYSRRLDVPMHQPWGKLSHGNRTKVCLLLALAQGAELLMLDEPTAGLDPVSVDQLLRLLVEDRKSEGRTVFLSSHQLSEIERIADWVGIIDKGKLLLETPMQQLREFRLVTATGTGLEALRASDVILSLRAPEAWTFIVAQNTDTFVAHLRQQGGEVIHVGAIDLRELFLMLVGAEEPCTPGNVGWTHVSGSFRS